MRRSKAPDAAHTARDQRIARFLCGACGNRQNADLNAVRQAPLAEAGNVQNGLLRDPGADERRRLIECGDDLDAVGDKAGICQQRAAKVPDADENGVMRVRITEILFNVEDQRVENIADLWPAPLLLTAARSFLTETGFIDSSAAISLQETCVLPDDCKRLSS